MTALTWDQVAERFYETGVDHGVLYIPDSGGDYNTGVAWNGLVAVTESPSGADVTTTYADNIQYLNLVAAEKFGATIEAYTYPDEFAQCDGTATPEAGVSIGQQTRKSFGLVYRTLMGNDTDGTDLGYKLHLVYGARCTPSEKAYNSVNDSPEALKFSWTVTTVPVAVTGYKPTSILTIDSTKVDETALGLLNDLLFGTSGDDPRLPLPDEVLDLFSGTVTSVRLTLSNAPTYNTSTHVITLPAVTGIVWKINGVVKSSGAQPAMSSGQSSHVTAHPSAGYTIDGDDDWDFDY